LTAVRHRIPTVDNLDSAQADPRTAGRGIQRERLRERALERLALLLTHQRAERGAPNLGVSDGVPKATIIVKVAQDRPASSLLYRQRFLRCPRCPWGEETPGEGLADRRLTVWIWTDYDS